MEREQGNDSTAHKEVRDYLQTSKIAAVVGPEQGRVSLFGQVVQTLPCCPIGKHTKREDFFFLFSGWEYCHTTVICIRHSNNAPPVYLKGICVVA